MGAHVMWHKGMGGLCKPYAAERTRFCFVHGVAGEVGLPISASTRMTRQRNYCGLDPETAEAGVHARIGGGFDARNGPASRELRTP